MAEVKNSWIITDNELENLIATSDCDFLGTSAYVETLYKIIFSLGDEELKNGFNIGLYGTWGSGKSSILRSLIPQLGDNYLTINFDCWKFSKDDLRRSLLLQLCDTDGSKKELESAIYFDKSEGNETNKISWKNTLKYLGLIVLIGIFGGYISKVIELKFTVFNECNWNFAVFSSCIASLSVFGKLFIEELKKSIWIKQSISFTKHSLFSPEQFHEKYTDILKNGKYSSKKIIFVFDNIDRCDDETVKEILMTIKTFLNQKDCIFIIPIDYDAVCKHFCSGDISQGDEYLRKIFNLGIHIKKPHNTDMKQLIIKILNTQNRKDHFNIIDEDINTIAFMLSQSFSNNPRKIKQFLNALGSEYLLHKDSTTTYNILQVMKYLIIKTEISELYKDFDMNFVQCNNKIKEYINNINKKNQDMTHSEQHKVSLLERLQSIVIVNRYSLIHPLSSKSPEHMELIKYYQNGLITEMKTIRENHNADFLNFLDAEILSYYTHKNNPQGILIGKVLIAYIGFYANNIVYKDSWKFFIQQILDYKISNVKLQDIYGIYKYITKIYGGNDDDSLSKILARILISTDYTENLLAYISDKHSESYKHFVSLDEKTKKILVNKSVFENLLKDVTSYDKIDKSIITFIAVFGNINGVRTLLTSNDKFFPQQYSEIILTQLKELGVTRFDKGEILIEKQKQRLETFKQWKQHFQQNSQSYGNQQSLTQILQTLEKNIEMVSILLQSHYEIDGFTIELFNILFFVYEKSSTQKENIFEYIYNNLSLWTSDDWNDDRYAGKIINYYKTDKNNKNIRTCILYMIEKTIDVNGIQKGLSIVQMEEIISCLNMSDQEKDIITGLWNNGIAKLVLLDHICKEDIDGIITKTNKVIELSLEVGKIEREYIGKLISSKIVEQLKNHLNIDKIYSFLKSKAAIIQYISKGEIKSILHYDDETIKSLTVLTDGNRKELIKFMK